MHCVPVKTLVRLNTHERKHWAQTKLLFSAFALDGFARASRGGDDISSAGSDETDRESVNFIVGSTPKLTHQQSTSSSSHSGSTIGDAGTISTNTTGSMANIQHYHYAHTSNNNNNNLSSNNHNGASGSQMTGGVSTHPIDRLGNRCLSVSTNSVANHCYYLYSTEQLLAHPQPPPAPVLPRSRKIATAAALTQQSSQPVLSIIPARAPLPPPRRIMSQQRYLQVQWPNPFLLSLTTNTCTLIVTCKLVCFSCNGC